MQPLQFYVMSCPGFRVHRIHWNLSVHCQNVFFGMIIIVKGIKKCIAGEFHIFPKFGYELSNLVKVGFN